MTVIPQAGNVSLNDETDQSKRTKQFRTVSKCLPNGFSQTVRFCMSTHTHSGFTITYYQLNYFLINWSFSKRGPGRGRVHCAPHRRAHRRARHRVRRRARRRALLTRAVHHVRKCLHMIRGAGYVGSSESGMAAAVVCLIPTLVCILSWSLSDPKDMSSCIETNTPFHLKVLLIQQVLFRC